MQGYQITKLQHGNQREMAQMEQLLLSQGLSRDANLDCSIGIFDGDYTLMATASAYKNTLRCVAVASEYLGMGLMEPMISYLTEHVLSQGYANVYVYTKCESAVFFERIGFHRNAEVEGKMVFLEYNHGGFNRYLDGLISESPSLCRSAAVVMNANPFTLGHRYLVETAAAGAELLHVFILSDDSSAIPYAIRRRLVEQGCAHLSNVVFHSSGDYMISSATFPSYFLSDQNAVIETQAKLDAVIFTKIAHRLNITDRYVGTEPYSRVTSLYNRALASVLPQHSIRVHELERMEKDGAAVSASAVRQALIQNDTAALRRMVPQSTYRYFLSEESRPVVDKLKTLDSVIHY